MSIETTKLPPGTRHRPECGHARLADCPLTPEDWREVHDAWLAFLALCRIVSYRAHAREARRRVDTASVSR